MEEPHANQPKPDDGSENTTRIIPGATSENSVNDGAGGATPRAGRGSSARTGSGWQPPSPEELQLDFPQYEIRCLLGCGGMGAVYKGWQKNLERFVAIKILPTGFDDGDVDFAGRFKREAKAMAQLKHNGIVAVHDTGRTLGGLLYFVMEYVDGTDVHRLVKERGRLEAAEALRITAAVCEALAYAHSQGLVHRDITPSNIMLDARGTVKIADFGLAKSNAPGSTIITTKGISIGTPDFMAPECLQDAEHVDHRADIYAVGVTLYQMLTGKLPRGRFAPPSVVVKGLDKRLDHIVDKALQAEPGHRYSSAIEMRTEILRVMPRDRQLASASRKGNANAEARPLAKPLIVAAIAAALCIGGWFIWKNRHRAVQPPPAVANEPNAIKLWDSAEQLPKEQGVRWENNAVRLDGRALRYTATPSRDAILRAEVRMNTDAVSAQIGLRYRPIEAGDAFYLLEVSAKEGFAVLSSDHLRKRTKLHTWPLPRAYASDEWLRFEMRAIGDEITVSAAGKILGTVHDSSLSEPGGVHFFAASGGYFRNITYVPLDKPSATASATKGENWVDLLKPEAAAMLELDGIAKPSPDGMLVSANGKAFVAGTAQPGRGDGAMRFRAPFVDKVTGSRLAVRARYDRIKGSGYALMVFNSTKVALQAWAGDGSAKKLQDFVLGKPLQPGQDYVLELRAVGTTLTALLNGETLGQIEDGTFKNGYFMVGMGAGQPVTVHALEYLNLSGPDSSGANTITRSSGVTLTSATKANPFTNTLGMKFVPVPGTGMLFSQWETRVKDYAEFAAANTVDSSWKKQRKEQADIAREPEHPVAGVSWEEANLFCKWLTEKETAAGKLPAGARYRLPTDEEWSRAVGLASEIGATPKERTGNNGTHFPWGSSFPPPNGTGGNYADSAFHEQFPSSEWVKDYTDGYATTAPVGSFPPNASGLYDLGGNVWEWCEDLYEPDSTERVMRGGSWVTYGRLSMASAFRLHAAPDSHAGTGFRCVLTSP